MDYAEMEKFVRESIRTKNSDFLEGLFNDLSVLPEGKNQSLLFGAALDEAKVELNASKRFAAAKAAATFYKGKNTEKYKKCLDRVDKEEIAHTVMVEECLPKTPAEQAQTVYRLLASEEKCPNDIRLKAAKIIEKGNGAFSHIRPKTFVQLGQNSSLCTKEGASCPVRNHQTLKFAALAF